MSRTSSLASLIVADRLPSPVVRKSAACSNQHTLQALSQPSGFHTSDTQSERSNIAALHRPLLERCSLWRATFLALAGPGMALPPRGNV
jgi:hypothetical protein